MNKQRKHILCHSHKVMTRRRLALFEQKAILVKIRDITHFDALNNTV